VSPFGRDVYRSAADANNQTAGDAELPPAALRYLTTIVPAIFGDSAQKYGYSPGRSNVTEYF